MSGLIPFQTQNGLSTREQRQLDQEIARTHARGSLLAAKHIARVEMVADVATEALFRGSEVATIANVLIARTPGAEAELDYIAKAGIAAMANVVIESGRNCRCRR
jgi:hypothetical protein